MIETYIIGGGIAGMIFAYYNKDALIIDKDLGGQNNCSFELGPRLIEKDVETELLLKELNLDTSTKKIKVGFFDKKFLNPSEDFKKKYLLLSRGKDVEESSGMNNMQKEMEVYNTTFKELSETLKNKIKVNHINNEVAEINTLGQNVKMNYTDKKFYFNKLISTIPLSEFCKLSNKKILLSPKEVCFIKLKKDFFDMKDYNFIYCLNKDFYRISNHEEYLVAEIKGYKSEKELKDIFGNSLLNFKNLNTQIITNKKMPKCKNVIFFGRYACNDKSIKIQDLIKKAKDLYRSET